LLRIFLLTEYLISRAGTIIICHFQWHHFRWFLSMKKNQKNPATDEPIRENREAEERGTTDETILNLPEVKDIPGQEHVRPPRMREFADTTASSDDEEGRRVFDEDQDSLDQSTNVSREEEDLLEKSSTSMAGEEDLSWERARLDNVDEDGEALNEENEFSGRDLDVPGSEDDDRNEDLGEEDEENNSYSLGGDLHD
jgi:hypothetical protein